MTEHLCDTCVHLCRLKFVMANNHKNYYGKQYERIDYCDAFNKKLCEFDEYKNKDTEKLEIAACDKFELDKEKNKSYE